MYIRDEIAQRALELIRQDVKEGRDYTHPWLNLDVQAYRAYREGETSVLPWPYGDEPGERMMMESEFHHLLSDIVNGLIAEGLSLRGLWENPWPDRETLSDELVPGSEAHRARYIPFGLRVVAEKRGANSA